MRVDYLFVVAIVPAVPTTQVERELVEDAHACMAALVSKYKHKCRSVMSLAFKYPKNFNSFLDWSIDDKSYIHSGIQNMGEFATVDSHLSNSLVNYGFSPSELDDIKSTERVGIYLVGNYDREDLVLETMMVEPVARMIKSMGLPKIDKLCLIACAAARVGVKSKENKKFPKHSQNANEKCFIYNLCQNLAPLTPMIAGWDGYVEVSTPSHQHGELGSKFTGDKVQKRVLHFRQGEPQWLLQAAGWSDK
ncbi:hypothetical protein [Nitratireductor sp. GCM10026969]|uniref:hypothetical protein n=1 Tax=Nitratireductor sp. GCM10026969 TaxID=3252645 RepID=UPI0036204E36